MKFQAATILATLLAAACAAPAPQSRNPATSDLEKRWQVNDCGNSSFEDQTTNGSPLVTDCQMIAKNIVGAGTWYVGSGPATNVVSFGTCNFDAQLSPPGTKSGVGIAKIGNQDIINLINDSIAKYAWNGKIGSKGKMPCQTFGIGDVEVVWGIY